MLILHLLRIKQNKGQGRIPAPYFYMRYILIILLVLLSGCSSLKFQPKGKEGNKIEYFYANQICDKCHKKTIFFKIVNKKKIICADCYEKFYYK